MKNTIYMVMLGISIICVLIFAVLANIHCWGKPLNLDIFYNITSSDWMWFVAGFIGYAICMIIERSK